MYVQPTSAAKAACAMQNMVVANVAIPRFSSSRHAWRPSQVAGILMQIRFVSYSGSRYSNVAMIPERGIVI